MVLQKSSSSAPSHSPVSAINHSNAIHTCHRAFSGPTRHLLHHQLNHQLHHQLHRQLHHHLHRHLAAKELLSQPRDESAEIRVSDTSNPFDQPSKRFFFFIRSSSAHTSVHPACLCQLPAVSVSMLLMHVDSEYPRRVLSVSSSPVAMSSSNA